MLLLMKNSLNHLSSYYMATVFKLTCQLLIIIIKRECHVISLYLTYHVT